MNVIPRLQSLAPNGALPLNLGWRGAFYKLNFLGGPYDAFPGRDQAFGVCVRAERVPEEVDVHLPIRDFDVPRVANDVDRAIRDTFRAALKGHLVYVGCMGGWGRTGLFLALLAKAAGVDDPVSYVREHYSPRAVETDRQKKYVEDFDVTEIRQWLWRYAWINRFPILRRILP